MKVMKKRLSLVLAIVMLVLAIVPFTVVSATETCQVTMTAKMGSTVLTNKGKYNVKGGETITISAKSSVSEIAFISYYFDFESYDARHKVYSDTINITVPNKPDGSRVVLAVEPVAKNDDGSANKITKTGWQLYGLVYPTTEVPTTPDEDTSITRDLKVMVDGKELTNNSTTTIKENQSITLKATDASKVSSIQYKWYGQSNVTQVKASEVTVTSPLKTGETGKLYVTVLYTDGVFLDGTTTGKTLETYNFTVKSCATPTPTPKKDYDLDIEPWMEECDETEELVVSLRNDSEDETRANKNIYELNETVTYYIDYKNGGKDIKDDVTIELELPLDYKVVDANGGDVDDDVISWTLDGIEEDEAGTIIVKVKYTDLKKKKDDANTIYPKASILKGSKVKDESTVINMIIREYDEEVDIDHEPYMFGDAEADTFRPDYLITRAEGALVLARIFGLDYKNINHITTKYTDINDTYVEAQKAITAASEAGLINGYLEDDGTYTYRPNNKMTKAEFMKILACMVEEMAEDEDIDGLEIKPVESLVKVYDDDTRYYIVDGKRVYTHWAIEEITLLARLNMLPLDEDNDSFELDEKISRAEVAQLINFYLLRAPAEVTSKTKTGFSDVTKKHKLVGDIIEATRSTHTFSITAEDGTEVAE